MWKILAPFVAQKMTFKTDMTFKIKKREYFNRVIFKKKKNEKLRNRRHLLYLNVYKLQISDFHEVVKIERWQYSGNSCSNDCINFPDYDYKVAKRLCQ